MAKRIFKISIDNQQTQQVSIPAGGTIRGVAVNKQTDRIYLLVEGDPSAALTDVVTVQVVTEGANAEVLKAFIGTAMLKSDKVAIAVYAGA